MNDWLTFAFDFRYVVIVCVINNKFISDIITINLHQMGIRKIGMITILKNLNIVLETVFRF